MSLFFFLLYYFTSKVKMSIAFIPIETTQDLFNNSVVSEKWNKLVQGITTQLSSSLHIKCTPELIHSILQETLEEHYTSSEKKNNPVSEKEKEKKQERTQCVHILKNNKQCPNKSNIGKTTCTRHSK